MTLNHKTQAKSIDVINIKDIYNTLPKKKKKKYPPSFFCVDRKTNRKRKKEVPLLLFKKIVMEYLKIYFYDFYMSVHPVYFPLGGIMKKVTYPKWVRYMAKGKSEKRITGGDNSIGLFWFLRASMKMNYLVNIKKLTGTTNQLPKIEKIYTTNFNKDLLPIFSQELKKAKSNKTLYLCTLI